MKQLVRKEYEIEILIPYFDFQLKNKVCLCLTNKFKLLNKKFLFKYKQGLFWDICKIWVVDGEFLYNFLNNIQKISKKQLWRVTIARQQEILQFILDTYAKDFFSNKQEIAVKNKAPFSSLIAYLIKETSETVETLNTYTWETIQFLIDWLVYNVNETTPEGKRNNRINSNLKEVQNEKLSDKEKEILNKL